MRTPNRRAIAIFIPLALAVTAAFAVDEGPGADHTRADVRRQEQIQADFHSLVADLDSTIDQYERNGLHGEALNALKKVRNILANVSDVDMAQVVALLRQAGGAARPGDALRNLSAAYSTQKGVLARIKAILDAEAADREAQALAEEAGALADRQAANLQTGIGTAQWTLAHTPGSQKDDADAAVAASLEVQTAEQQSIAGDMARLQAGIGQFAGKTNDPALLARFKKGIAEAALVAPQISAATGLLNQKKLFEAVASEKPARDGLRQLARTIAPPLDEADALRTACEQLDKIIGGQKSLITATGRADVPPIDQWLAAILKNQKGGLYSVLKKAGVLALPLDQMLQSDPVKSRYAAFVLHAQSDLPGYENEQGDLVNRSDALSQDISQIAPPASGSLASALPPMQSARGSLIDKKAGPATQSQNEALVWLLKAKTMLEQQLAQIKTDAPGDPTAITPSTTFGPSITDASPSPASGAPTAGTPPTSGEPTAGTPPTSGTPTAGTPPTSGAPTAGTPPTSGEPTAGTPPTSGTPTAGTPPTSGAPTAGTPPTSGEPTAGTPPTSGTPAAGTPPTSGAPTAGTPPTSGTPTAGTPPTSGAPTAGTPPTSGEPTAGTPPTSGTPAAGTPPTSGAPTAGTPPTSGAPTAGTPPTSGAPTAGASPASGTPAAGAPAAGIASTPGAPGSSPSGTGDGPGAADGGGRPQGSGDKIITDRAKFIPLPSRSGPALQAAQLEKYPPAYAAKIEQYMRNLADETSPP